MRNAVGGDPFAVLLADDFLTDYKRCHRGSARAFADSGKAQLSSCVEVDGPDISKYGVVVLNGLEQGLRDWLKNPALMMHPQTLRPSGVMSQPVFKTLRSLTAGSGGEIQLADAINIHAQHGSVETVCLNGLRFDCGSINGFMAASNYEYKKRCII